MDNLSRVTGKTFGETATATGEDPQIGQFGSAKAGTYVGTTDVATIQGLSAWSNGFIDSVTPETQFPPLPEVTGVLKVLSYQENYLLQKGIAEWDSATTYYSNDFCKVDNSIYYSLQDNNIGNAPSSSPTFWRVFDANGANKDLSNLSTTGQTVLNSKLNKSMISDCILASPNGIIDTSLNSTSFTIKTGLKVLIPNGLNADGTYNNTEYTLPADTAVSVASTADGLYGINLYSNGTVALYGLNNMVYSSVAPNFAPSMLWYNQFTNYYKYTVDSGVNWTSIALTCVGYISVISGKVNFWQPKRPFVSLDASSMCFIAPANGNRTASINNFPVVQNNYVNGGSGCRIWTDGFKEQWGSSVGTGTSTMQGVGFLQNFRDTNYSVVATITDMDSGYSNIIKIVAIGAKAVNGFSFVTAYPTAYAAFTINWYACGY